MAQLAFVALSLLLGRRINPVEYPEKGVGLLDEFIWVGPRGSSAPRGLRSWLERALQLGDRPFESADEAQAALVESLPAHESQALRPNRTSFHVFNRLADPPVQVATTMSTPSTPMLDFPAEQDRSNPFESVGQASSTRLVEFPRHVPADGTSPGENPEGGAGVGGPRRAAFGMTPVKWIVAALAVLAIAEGGVILGIMRAPASPAKAPATAAKPGGDVHPAATDAAKPEGAPVPPGVTAAAAGLTGLEGPGAGLPPISLSATQGRLDLSSDPVGAKVTVDGAARGVTPLALPLSAGPHTVLMTEGSTTTTRNVTISAGSTMTFMASFPTASGPLAGWVSIKVPVDLQVREGTTFLGTTSADRLMLSAGHHDLDISSAMLGFQTTLPIEIVAGKTASVTVPVPNGTISLNALPWATVTIDGRALTGTTPFANIEIPLGSHEIVWRHPQLGERRQTVVVTAKSPLRLVTDLTK